jgi:hypothetical protein
VNGNTAAISSEATARANADSALSSSITALGVQTASDISAAVATEATARADADSALSSSISTLSSQVNGDIAAIETTQTAQASTLTGLSAQFTVKTDLNGFVTGFGFASTDAVDDDPHSEFVILANSLQLVSPTGAGGVKTPFAVTEVETGVWKALLNADVLIGGNLSVANLSTGALPNDVLFSLGGGVVELDGAGEIRVFKDLTENADYVRLTSGEIRFLTYAGGAYQTYNYLKRLEVGAANNNTLVTIPGYWKAQPKVMVSPASLKLYDSAYSGQSQSINCAPGTVTETSPGSGVWQFTPTATLTLGGNTGSSAINNTSGSTSSNSWTSSTQTTPANCSQITPTVSLQSQRGNGSSQYYYRSVKWRIEYWDGAQWVAGSYRTVAMGAQFGAISDSVAFDFPSAGTWQWRIYSEAFDTNGTVFGSVSYEYSTATRTNAGSVSDTLSGYGTKNITLNLGAYSVPSGWSIYRVDWNYSVSWYLYASTGGTASVSAPNFSKSLFKDPGSTTTSGSQSVTYQNTSATSYNGDLTGTLYNYGGAFGGAQSDLTISNGTATIYIRRPAPNSTTAANVYTLVSYAYSLTSAQILATGSLNWVAIGE